MLNGALTGVVVPLIIELDARWTNQEIIYYLMRSAERLAASIGDRSIVAKK